MNRENHNEEPVGKPPSSFTELPCGLIAASTALGWIWMLYDIARPKGEENQGLDFSVDEKHLFLILGALALLVVAQAIQWNKLR